MGPTILPFRQIPIAGVRDVRVEEKPPICGGKRTLGFGQRKKWPLGAPTSVALFFGCEALGLRRTGDLRRHRRYCGAAAGSIESDAPSCALSKPSRAQNTVRLHRQAPPTNEGAVHRLLQQALPDAPPPVLPRHRAAAPALAFRQIPYEGLVKRLAKRIAASRMPSCSRSSWESFADGS